MNEIQRNYAQWQTNRYLQADPFAYAQAQTAAQNNYASRCRAMTAADLGIIDQNLDDKIGMEP